MQNEAQKPDSDDEKRFNETLKRMLKTPPKPKRDKHDAKKEKAASPKK